MFISNIIALVIGLAAVFSYINHRLIKWPPAIGIMILSLGFSLLLVLSKSLDISALNKLAMIIAKINFRELLLNFMLSFLLFAGAMHVDAKKLHRERFPVTALALFGTVVSSGLVGYFTWLMLNLCGHAIPFIYCLIFGTIVSPTDPIAVLSILKQARIPASLEIKISGESLFNDGVGVVLFITITEAALSGNFSFLSFSKLFLQEAGGGLVFGALLGYLGYLLLRSVDDYKVEVLITLALVSGGYALADKLHISGPLAMVVAGLITGGKTRHEGLSETSWDYLGKFWELIDEILNAVLFMLIGLELLVIKFEPLVLIIGLFIIFIVLGARLISVAVPVRALSRKIRFEKNAVSILTWGGLKGGLSIALALSLDTHMYRDTFVLLTYIVVVFSILVQGLTIGKFVKWLQKRRNKTIIPA